MTGLRIKLGAFELELSEEQTDNLTFIVFVGMLGVLGLAVLILVGA